MKNYETIDQIKADCPKFFGETEMRMFGSRIGQTVFAGRFFITSEKMTAGHSKRSRKYTIREVVEGENGKPYISRIGEFMQYATSVKAITALKHHIKELGMEV